MGHDEPVLAKGAATWRADAIGGKAGLSHALTIDDCAAIDALIDATADIPTLDVRSDSFSDPRLASLAKTCSDALTRGRGAIILTGFDAGRYSAAQYRTLYWYLGQLLGEPAPQSERGDLLGYVRQEKENPFGRGYISNLELTFHNDFHEILSLACVAKASVGGESGLVSSRTIHDILRAERPDLLNALYRGWYDGMEAFYQIFRPRAELDGGFVPFFFEAQGEVWLHGLNAMFSNRAATERDMAMPDAFPEAFAAVQEIAGRPGIAARFILEPGEMMFWHNWKLLHARNAFENEPVHERALMRLWLYPHEGALQIGPARERARAVDRIHRDIGARQAVPAG